MERLWELLAQGEKRTRLTVGILLDWRAKGPGGLHTRVGFFKTGKATWS